MVDRARRPVGLASGARRPSAGGIATRRQFMALLAGASVYAGFGTVLAADHRAVTVAGKRARVIDVHAHCAFAEVAPLLTGTPLAREIPGSQRLGPERIAAMDARGIDMQALSVNQYWWYAADKE